MFIKKLDLYNFRNCYINSFELKYGSNLIYGNNGAGKTSILEALYILAFGKSFYNVNRKEIVKYGEKEFSVTSLISSEISEKVVSCRFDNKGFRLDLDDKKSTISEINRHYYPLYFSSSNYTQLIESRTLLRKLFNRFIHGIDLLYLHHILSYNKTLQQKNYLLKQRNNYRALDSWNRTISDAGSRVVNSRFQFTEMLNRKIEEITNQNLKMVYRSSVETKGNSISPDGYYEYLRINSDKEKKSGRSLSGPHLDFFNFTLNDKDLKFYSSGEKKFALFNIFFAYIELFNDIKKTYPVFLIDDFDIAIDKENINKLVDKYPDMQVVATSVNYYERFNNLIELKKEN